MKRGEVCRVAERGKRLDDGERRKDMMLAMFLIVVTMLIEDVLTLLLMVVLLKCPHATPLSMTQTMARNQPTIRTLQQLQPKHETPTVKTVAITKLAKQHSSHARMPIIALLAKRDLARQYAVGNSTSRNTVYIFLLHYNCSINSRLLCASIVAS